MTTSRPKASIVVLCYNGLKEVTQPCIASILTNTPRGAYELIVVDNASSDGTAEWINKIALEHAHIRPVLNHTNRGYAGGNNDGMRLANGEYIVLLNNDTLVTEGWLQGLLRLLETRPDIGLVGPVTNSAGNEQRIELPNLSERNYEDISGQYVRRQQGVWFSTHKLGFFCVAMRRSLPEKIGFLDENFGVGMFEDDDYCMRATRNGYSLAVVEDCFVYHKGSVSFKKLAVAEYKALFDRNREYFFEKHKIEWSLTDLAFSYADKFGADIAAYSARVDVLPPEVERLQVRMENFRHLLVQIYDAELAARNTSGGLGAGSPTAKRALWHTRKRIIVKMVIKGTWRDRIDFVRMAANYVRRRFIRHSFSQQAEVRAKNLAALSAIRDQHENKRIVIFPATIDFHYMEQRPQQLARAFAQSGFLVFYGTLNHNVDRVASIESADKNLYLLNENIFPLLSHVFRPENCIYYCLWPNNVKHLEYLPYSSVVYDYMDELSLLDLSAEVIERQHHEILTRADLVTVSAEQLFEKLPKEVQCKSLLIPNAVSDHFINAIERCSTVPDEPIMQLDGVPILGYYGAIAEWLDFDLLSKLAIALPHARIVLIGPVFANVKPILDSLVINHENIFVLPAKRHLDLIPYLKRFDVCLIPFVKNEITDAVSPVKLFEYFAARKPVISTALRECQKYAPVKIANNHSEFIGHIIELLSKSYIPSAEVKSIAKNNTWRLRVKKIAEMIEQRPQRIQVASTETIKRSQAMTSV